MQFLQFPSPNNYVPYINVLLYVNSDEVRIGSYLND